MAHIIALQGAGNCGKTSTLIEVFKALKDKYPSAVVEELHGSTHDIKVILRGIDGSSVGIESQGDPGSRLKQSLADFLARKCNIIFCACRTRGQTVEWVRAYGGAHSVQFVRQIRAVNGHAGVNAATATTLIRLAGL